MNDMLREHPYTRVIREVLIISCKIGQDLRDVNPKLSESGVYNPKH